MSHQVQTEVWTLKSISEQNIAFVIPSYQRPYVWSEDDVKKLFQDIVGAFENNDSHYYIGTVLTAKNSQSTGLVYELVDGQQRTTTLILISLAFKYQQINSELNKVATHHNQPRLTFAIRDQVQALLSAWLGLKTESKPSDADIKKDEYLQRLDEALKVLNNQLAQLKDKLDLAALAQYIFNHVQWVNNVMPTGMDVNKLFTTANNSGIQLEQTDILKAFLLKKIITDKARYEAIWQACEQMDNYFERNAKQIFVATDWKTIQPETLAQFDARIFLLTDLTDDKVSPLSSERDKTNQPTINNLANDKTGLADKNDDHTGKINTTEEYGDIVYCRSIISFALLLLHAYRIFLHQQGQQDISGKFHPDRLIKTFEAFFNKALEDEVKAFLECLWQVRYQFDRCVVKWVKQTEDNEQHLTLTNIIFSEKAIQRTPIKATELSALQSVSYFTSGHNTQYWLTPLLGWLIEQQATPTKETLSRLEQIDDSLSLAQLTQKEASFVLLQGANPTAKSIDEIITYLIGSKGTGFEHYWFQKLEYLLLKHQEAYLKGTDPIKLEKYRITSKNSVEHVYPQNERYGRKLSDDRAYLDAFGNLVLLSVGQNSAYGNDDVSIKESKFYNKPTIDSLKLAHIFVTKKALGEWSENAITQHQDIMLNLLRKHYLGLEITKE